MKAETKERKTKYERITKETSIKISINLDGSGKYKINTGLGFFNHMLEQLAKHSNIDLTLNVKGDLHVDEHHTVEDAGIGLGEAINKALGDKRGIARYGFLLPMDDSVTECAIDLGGRPFLVFKCKFNREFVGDFPTELTKEFFKSFAQGLRANIYIKTSGENDHHKIESMFKAVAKSLNEAFKFDPRSKKNLPSTKGIL